MIAHIDKTYIDEIYSEYIKIENVIEKNKFPMIFIRESRNAVLISEEEYIYLKSLESVMK